MLLTASPNFLLLSKAIATTDRQPQPMPLSKEKKYGRSGRFSTNSLSPETTKILQCVCPGGSLGRVTAYTSRISNCQTTNERKILTCATAITITTITNTSNAAPSIDALPSHQVRPALPTTVLRTGHPTTTLLQFATTPLLAYPLIDRIVVPAREPHTPTADGARLPPAQTTSAHAHGQRAAWG